MIERVELDFLPDFRDIDFEGRIRNKAEEAEFSHSDQKLLYLFVDLFCFFSNSHLSLYFVEYLVNAFGVLYFVHDLLIGGLESFPQNIGDRSINVVETSCDRYGFEAGSKIAFD